MRLKIILKSEGKEVENPQIMSNLEYKLFDSNNKLLGKGGFDKNGCSKVYKTSSAYQLYVFKIYSPNSTLYRQAMVYSLDSSVDNKFKRSIFYYKYTVGQLLRKPNSVQEVRISRCPHKVDGAIAVANFIVNEIQVNARSELANFMRASNTANTANPASKLAALGIWTERVFKGREWDHKHIISRTPSLQAVAVHRKLYNLEAIRVIREGKVKADIQDSKSYWHKYKKHDYFYDVWSNIHYGYVGLSCGFSKKKLLEGASVAQFLDSSGKEKSDAPDDILAIKIGFSLFDKFGLYADKMNANDLLDALERASFSFSRDTHICRHPHKKELQNNGSKL